MAAFPFSEQERRNIETLCRRFGVRRLKLFGSAARKDFDPATSDFDFVVEFGRSHDFGPADQYFGFKEKLESLLGRPVDLVEECAIRNPYFRQEVEETSRDVYAA